MQCKLCTWKVLHLDNYHERYTDAMRATSKMWYNRPKRQRFTFEGEISENFQDGKRHTCSVLQQPEMVYHILGSRVTSCTCKELVQQEVPTICFDRQTYVADSI